MSVTAEVDNGGVASDRNVLVERWHETSPGVRLALGAVVLLVLLFGIGEISDLITGGRRSVGPGSSSFATSPEGLAAYASLLERSGVDVTSRRQSLDEAPGPRSDAALVVVDSDLTVGERELIGRMARAGQRVVVAGQTIRELTDHLDDLPELRYESADDGGTATVAAPERWSGARRLAVDGQSVFEAPVRSGRIEVRTKTGAVAVTGAGGAGVVTLADSSFLTNRRLGDRDNAAFALALIGDARSVVFAEAGHGYRPGTASGLPARWKWFLAGLFIAAVAAMVADGRRNGPPEQPVRDLPPARLAYVEALAGVLARSSGDQQKNPDKRSGKDAP